MAETQRKGIGLAVDRPIGGSGVRRPQQGRSQAAWLRILTSGLELLKEAGYEGFTISAICARAGVGPPAIYARVRTKDALFLAVFDHGYGELSRETEATRARLSGGSADDIVRSAVGAIAVSSLTHARFLRTVILRAEADPNIALRTRRARVATAAWFRGVVLAQASALTRIDTPWIDSCFRQLFMMIVARIVAPSAMDLGDGYTDEAFVADLQETAARLLLRDADQWASGLPLISS